LMRANKSNKSATVLFNTAMASLRTGGGRGFRVLFITDNFQAGAVPLRFISDFHRKSSGCDN